MKIMSLLMDNKNKGFISTLSNTDNSAVIGGVVGGAVAFVVIAVIIALIYRKLHKVKKDVDDIKVADAEQTAEMLEMVTPTQITLSQGTNSTKDTL